jgi:hypothetical protein
VEPKLKLGSSTVPVGLLVIAAVSTTLPENPSVGVRLMLTVFSFGSPGARVICGEFERVKNGPLPEVTTTVVDAVALV